MGSDKGKSGQSNQEKDIPKTYEVTAEGSLGLLAMGAVGIRAWRKKREEEKLNSKPETNNE